MANFSRTIVETIGVQDTRLTLEKAEVTGDIEVTRYLLYNIWPAIMMPETNYERTEDVDIDYD